MSAPSGGEELDRDRLVWIYDQMLRIREFEERVKRTFLEHPGVIRGHTHLADGAEASIVGSIATLGPDDQFFATYRCHGYPIARGTDVQGDDGRDLRPQGRPLQGARRLDAPRPTSRNGFLGTSGIVGAGIPHAAGAAWAAQIRKQGQVVLCFFGDGASKQGAFDETLNIASLWKLPIVFVMENNGYNVHTRTEQEDANRANGEDLSVKAKAYSMPGVTIDGRDPVAVYETVGAAVARARAGDGPTLVESQMYRLSAHGNIIAPPGVPLHFPEHEAIEKFGAPEEYEAALQGDPVPAFRGRLVADGTLTAEEADEIAEAVREEMQAAVTLRARQPVPGRRTRPSTTSTPEEAIDHGTRTALHRRHQRGDHARDGARRHRPVLRPEHGHDRERAVRRRVRQGPRPRHADLRDRRDRHGASAPRWPATAPWSSCTWPSSCSSRWTRSSTRRHASAP